MLTIEYNCLLLSMYLIYIYENNFFFFHLLNVIALFFILNYDSLKYAVDYYLIEKYHKSDYISLNHIESETEYENSENEKSEDLSDFSKEDD